MISVFGGSGFIGGNYCKMFSDQIIKIDREDRKPKSKDILYFIFIGSSPAITDFMIEYIEAVIDLYFSKFL